MVVVLYQITTLLRTILLIDLVLYFTGPNEFKSACCGYPPSILDYFIFSVISLRYCRYDDETSDETTATYCV